uniref:Ubiquitin-like protease family profile domain-containing protein n=1 Tax=Panagrolaimus sp. JU765 TaxID=591449 RepID=A0AC34QX62_9BILA
MMMSNSSFFNTRKRFLEECSPNLNLPFKKLYTSPADYLEAISDDDYQQTRSSYSSDRFVSGCSSSGEEMTRFEYISDDGMKQVQTSSEKSVNSESEEDVEMDESDLSESFCSTSSSGWTEREEDGYASDFFFAVDTASESEDEPMTKYVAVTVLDKTTEMVRVRFPFTSIRIKVSDFMCLGEGDFIPPSVVDFYLNHLVSNIIDEEKYRVHVFGAMFWHRLRLNIFKADQHLDRQDRLHSQFKCLRNYMSHIGLFENDFAIFPINELDHWSLGIVCNLESVIPEDYIIEGLTDDGQPLPRHKPCILMLDPFGSENEDNRANLTKYGTIIRDLLEYQYSMLIAKGDDCHGKFTQDSFPIVFPKNLPHQVNFCDSGIYVLEYATNFLSNPPSLETLASESFDFKQTYPKFTTKKKRSDIQGIIMSLCKDKDKWRKILDGHY